MPRRPKQLSNGSAVGQIGVHDPFELIRHLARSQSDPRKAVAELVQNALDEQALHVNIERLRDRGEAVLSIVDDGHGVLPELPRKDALASIATNIGHSRKRQLSFEQRMRQAKLGQYGIGLLGFWSVGHELRISPTSSAGRAPGPRCRCAGSTAPRWARPSAAVWPTTSRSNCAASSSATGRSSP